MNGDTNNHQMLTVTSVGNAWVICNSKSRPGFKYYFNTLSGQSVWNLSPEEIEKAKKYTKALPISEIEKCPEPTMDPPIDVLSRQSSQQHHNEQAQMTRPPPQTPNMLPMNLLNLNNLPGLAATLNSISGLPTNMNMPGNLNMQGFPGNLNIQGLPGTLNTQGFPTNINNTSGLPTNLNNMPQMQANLNSMSGPSGLNPFVWNTANNPMQAQPIIYIVAQPPAGYPVHQNLPTQDITYNHLNEQLPQNQPTQDILYSNLNEDEETLTSVNKVFNRNLSPGTSNKPDLRQKLMRKRRISESQESSYHHMNTQQPTIDSQKRNKISYSTNKSQEENSKYDLSVLDNLKPSNSTLLNWFIVVDTKIILENFPFLNKVTDPDQNCYLVVPEHVMCELQELVNESTDMPTRRILRFLGKQIESELAFRGDVIRNSADDRYKMYATCEPLAESNNVVLLSDDPGLGRYKNKHTNIHVFRLNEFNQILTDKRTNRPVRLKSPTLSIKIHVPNDSHCRDGGETSLSFTRDQVAKSGGGNFRAAHGDSTCRAPEKVHPQTPKNKETDPSQAQLLNESMENIQMHNAIQDIQTKQATLLSKNSTDEVDNHKLSVKTSEPVEHETQSQSQSTNESKKPIVLSRNTQSTTGTENNNPQTKYRWRKKRLHSSKSEVSKTSEQSNQAEPAEPRTMPPPVQQAPNTEERSNILEKIVQEPEIPPIRERSNVLEKIVQEPEISPIRERSNVLEKIVQEPEISPIRERSLERSSISSYRPIDRSNVIIEETSTSGIISNSTEVDSLHRKDSVSSSAKETVSVCDDVNFVRHQVVGQTMEEVLRARREEWVLRFVQIMEDALRDMLRESLPSEVEDNYTAPWATDLPDLSRCIIKKFNDHFNVVDAANRLSFTLHRISDGKGNVSANIEPRQYMDMYSYGVYLIESLKQVTGNCDDLSTSEESLKKLLYDIQNANQDCCHNDTFLDKLNDNIANVPETELEKPPKPLVCSISDVEKRSLQREFSNTETNFFSNLSLTRRSSDRSLNTPSSTPNSARIAPTRISSPKTPASPKNLPNIKALLTTNASSNISKDNTTSENEQKNQNAKDTLVPTNTSDVKIVRRFVNIPQLEEKLKKIQCDNYSVHYDDYDKCEMDDEYYDENELEDGEIYDQETGEYEEEEKAILGAESNDASVNSEILIKALTDELMGPIGSVKNLCSKIVEDLKNSRKPSPEMQGNLKNYFSIMIKLRNTLKSIIDRDSKEHENNLVGLLEKANLHAYIPDNELYMSTIKECLKQFDTYHRIATQVMSACTQQVT